ncbi:gamma-glutamylcyclotransferase, partial [Rhizobium leguminosarum]
MAEIREHNQSAVHGSKLLMTGSTMALTDELVSLSLRPAIDVGPEPHRKPLTEAEVEML